jgi:hypothetical protein
MSDKIGRVGDSHSELRAKFHVSLISSEKLGSSELYIKLLHCKMAPNHTNQFCQAITSELTRPRCNHVKTLQKLGEGQIKIVERYFLMV